MSATGQEAGETYTGKLKLLEERMKDDTKLRRKTARVVYFSSVLGTGVYALCLLGFRLRASIPKLILFAYTMNPVSEFSGDTALRLYIDSLLPDSKTTAS